MAKNEQKLNILDPNIAPKALIFGLVWPMIIEEIMSILVNFVDTAMVGSVGVNATASVAVSSPVIGLCNGVAIGLGSGFGVMMSRRIGEGKKDEALKVMQQSMYYILGMGIFMTLLFSFIFADHLPQWMNAQPDIWGTSSDYLRYFGYSRLFVVMTFICSAFLRGQGQTKAPMVGNLIANISNAIMNFLFIYPTRTITVLGTSFTMWGLGQGVAGAAIATSVANVLQCSFMVYKLFTAKLTVPFHLGKMEKPDIELYKFSFRLGAPNALERLVTSMGMMVCTSLLAGISNQVVSAHSLAGTGESIIFMSVMGFGQTATTLVAQWLGAGDKDRAQLLASECIKIAATVAAAATVFVFITCPFIIDVFTNDADVIRMACQALRIQCIVEILEATAMTMSGVLRGAGDVKVTAIASMTGMWCIRIVGANLLIRCFGFELLGVWIPMALDWVCRFTILFTRYKSGKWKESWSA